MIKPIVFSTNYVCTDTGGNADGVFYAPAEAYIKQSLKMEDFDENPVSIDELKSIFKYYDEEMKPSPPVMQTLLLVRLLMRKSVQKRNH